MYLLTDITKNHEDMEKPKYAHYAYACTIQDEETLHEVQKLTKDHDITAVMFDSTNGDYNDLWVAYGWPSYRRDQTWHKVIESAPIKYWVTMTDKFMSGWGEARNKINKLVFPCTSWAQAQAVMTYAESRGDLKYINVRTSKPYYNARDYYVQFKTIADYPRWYGID